MTNTTLPEEEITYPLVTGPYTIFSNFSLILSNVLLYLILTYLNNVSLAKECVLLHLYKDVVTTWGLMNCIWEIRVILCYWSGDGLGVGVIEARILSFLLYCLTLYCFTLINIISVLKLYMTKSLMLDPPMPWGEDERSAMKLIRTVSFILTIGFTSTMYALGLYPKLYFHFVQNAPKISLQELEVTTAFPWVLIFLAITCTITILVEKFFQSNKNHLIDAIVPKQLNLFLWILLIGLPLMLINRIVFQSNNFWGSFIGRLFFIFYLFIGRVLTPAFVILKTDQLKAYVTKIFRNVLDEAFLLNIYVAPTMLTITMYCTLCLFYRLFNI